MIPTGAGAQPGGEAFGHLPPTKFSKYCVAILKLSKNKDEILYSNHFLRNLI